MKMLARFAGLLGTVLLATGAGAALAQTGITRLPNAPALRFAPAGGLCGGIAGIRCPTGEQCVMTGPPAADQAGVCRPVQTPPPPSGGGHTVCPQIFKPVCGVNNVTYPNRCIAGARGVAVAHDGACGATPPPPKICPQIVMPVCGVNGVTYPNRCIAESRGVAVAHDGQCGLVPPPRPTPIPTQPTQVCSDLWQPVCGRDGHTYPNRCTAGASGVGVRHPGQCRHMGGYGPPAGYGDPGEGLPPQPVPYGSYPPPSYAPPPPPPRYGERG